LLQQKIDKLLIRLEFRAKFLAHFAGKKQGIASGFAALVNVQRRETLRTCSVVIDATFDGAHSGELLRDD
jgi:hypothetical protein